MLSYSRIAASAVLALSTRRRSRAQPNSRLSAAPSSPAPASMSDEGSSGLSPMRIESGTATPSIGTRSTRFPPGVVMVPATVFADSWRARSLASLTRVVVTGWVLR